MNKRENIYSLKGFSKVFKFTVSQTFKNKGYLVSLIIFVVVMTVMGPIQYAFQHAGESAAKDSLSFDSSNMEIDNLIIFDQVAVPLEKDDLEELYNTDEDEESEEGKGITEDKVQIHNVFDAVLMDEEIFLDSISKSDVGISIEYDETGFAVKGVVSEDTVIATDDLDSITEIVKEAFDKKRLADSDISDEDIQMIFSGVDTNSVVTESDYTVTESREINSTRYMFYMLGFAMIVFIVISMSTSYIITSVTEEKQSKLVESLLVSVRPMALLLGKVCGMMSYVVLVLVCGVIGSSISSYVMTDVLNISEEEFSTQGFNFSIFKDFGAFGGFCLLLSIVLAFLAFGMISGLFGSTCNKTEDIQNATGNVMTFSMISYFASIVVGVVDKDIVNVIGAILPPFSFFVAPVSYVTGRIGIAVLLVSYLIQIVAIILIVRLAAKSYRNLLLSDSTTQKLKTIFKSAKG